MTTAPTQSLGRRYELSPVGRVEAADDIHLMELQRAITLGETPDIQRIRSSLVADRRVGGWPQALH